MLTVVCAAAGAAHGASCDAAGCVPGGGSIRSDCAFEWLVTPVPALAGNGLPGRKPICYEGDPLCDADLDVGNHSCTFPLTLCINNQDTRLPQCTPSDVAAFEVRKPSAGRLRDSADGDNLAALENGVNQDFGVTVQRDGSPYLVGMPNATTDLCGTVLPIEVPLRVRHSGKVVRGRKTLRVASLAFDGRRDADSLKLECRPSTCGNGVVESSHEDCDDGNRLNGDGCNQGCRLEPATPTPTATPMPADTATATATATPVATGTATATATPTATATHTATASHTPSATASASATDTLVPPTATASATKTAPPPTATATATHTPPPATATDTAAPPTATATSSATDTATATPTETATATAAAPTDTATAEATGTATVTETQTPTPTATWTAPSIVLGITAFRPQSESYGGPFQRHAVPTSENLSPGVGVRINGDDDNGNSVADLLDTSVAGENDLIELTLQANPFPAPAGYEYVLARSDGGIKIWNGSTKGGSAVLGVNDEAVVAFSAATRTVWVERINAGNTTLELAARPVGGGSAVASSDVNLFAFTSVVIALGGENQVPSDPPDSNHGMFNIALTLYQMGYDVHMYDEDVVNSSGAGAAYDEVVRAVSLRGIGIVSIYGYSHGGGSTHDLAGRLDTNRASIGTFTMPYTAYVDGIRNSSDIDITSETRLPPSTAYHVNYYQRNDFLLRGNSVPGSNVDVNVSTTPWGSGLVHTSVDDHPNVRDGVLLPLLAHVPR
jgi:cysteine-rich repeat protein